MRKVHLAGDLAGESTRYWETVWDGVDRVAVAANQRDRPDRLNRLIADVLPPEGRIAEFGAGAATRLASLAMPGRSLFGLDLAKDATVRNASVWPDIHFVVGDISDTPLADSSLDCVISLGVVEHLESGPERLLAEHARVLRSGGLGLISVPLRNVVRSAKDPIYLDLLRRPSYTARGRLITAVREPGPSPSPGRFHQYEMGTSTFCRYLTEAGFEIESTHRYLVSAGIGEVSSLWRKPATGLQAAKRAVDPNRRVPLASSPDSIDLVAGTTERESTSEPSRSPRSPKASALKRAILEEQPETAIERAICAASQVALAHMVLAVVRKR